MAAGDVVGVLDLPASHCFPRACLHWGWRRGDTYLDPLDLVGGGPVRLLPLWRDEPVASGGLARRPCTRTPPGHRWSARRAPAPPVAGAARRVASLPRAVDRPARSPEPRPRPAR